ncbi:uncharacterized protein LOC142328091 [Lycorma delicatula]|uniref:uncharacterized protein LOC142328091 n=1 Tax=Lycorma delicatula TaxID=130591 RepID=UPI003F51438A
MAPFRDGIKIFRAVLKPEIFCNYSSSTGTSTKLVNDDSVSNYNESKDLNFVKLERKPLEKGRNSSNDKFIKEQIHLFTTLNEDKIYKNVTKLNSRGISSINTDQKRLKKSSSVKKKNCRNFYLNNNSDTNLCNITKITQFTTTYDQQISKTRNNKAAHKSNISLISVHNTKHKSYENKHKINYIDDCNVTISKDTSIYRTKPFIESNSRSDQATDKSIYCEDYKNNSLAVLVSLSSILRQDEDYLSKDDLKKKKYKTPTVYNTTKRKELLTEKNIAGPSSLKQQAKAKYESLSSIVEQQKDSDFVKSVRKLFKNKPFLLENMFIINKIHLDYNSATRYGIDIDKNIEKLNSCDRIDVNVKQKKLEGISSINQKKKINLASIPSAHLNINVQNADSTSKETSSNEVKRESKLLLKSAINNENKQPTPTDIALTLNEIFSVDYSEQIFTKWAKSLPTLNQYSFNPNICKNKNDYYIFLDVDNKSELSHSETGKITSTIINEHKCIKIIPKFKTVHSLKTKNFGIENSLSTNENGEKSADKNFLTASKITMLAVKFNKEESTDPLKRSNEIHVDNCLLNKDNKYNKSMLKALLIMSFINSQNKTAVAKSNNSISKLKKKDYTQLLIGNDKNKNLFTENEKKTKLINHDKFIREDNFIEIPDITLPHGSKRPTKIEKTTSNNENQIEKDVFEQNKQYRFNNKIAEPLQAEQIINTVINLGEGSNYLAKRLLLMNKEKNVLGIKHDPAVNEITQIKKHENYTENTNLVSHAKDLFRGKKLNKFNSKVMVDKNKSQDNYLINKLADLCSTFSAALLANVDTNSFKKLSAEELNRSSSSGFVKDSKNNAQRKIKLIQTQNTSKKKLIDMEVKKKGLNNITIKMIEPISHSATGKKLSDNVLKNTAQLKQKSCTFSRKEKNPTITVSVSLLSEYKDNNNNKYINKSCGSNKHRKQTIYKYQGSLKNIFQHKITKVSPSKQSNEYDINNITNSKKNSKSENTKFYDKKSTSTEDVENKNRELKFDHILSPKNNKLISKRNPENLTDDKILEPDLVKNKKSLSIRKAQIIDEFKTNKGKGIVKMNEPFSEQIKSFNENETQCPEYLDDKPTIIEDIQNSKELELTLDQRVIPEKSKRVATQISKKSTVYFEINEKNKNLKKSFNVGKNNHTDKLKTNLIKNIEMSKKPEIERHALNITKTNNRIFTCRSPENTAKRILAYLKTHQPTSSINMEYNIKKQKCPDNLYVMNRNKIITPVVSKPCRPQIRNNEKSEEIPSASIRKINILADDAGSYEKHINYKTKIALNKILNKRLLNRHNIPFLELNEHQILDNKKIMKNDIINRLKRENENTIKICKSNGYINSKKNESNENKKLTIKKLQPSLMAIIATPDKIVNHGMKQSKNITETGFNSSTIEKSGSYKYSNEDYKNYSELWEKMKSHERNIKMNKHTDKPTESRNGSELLKVNNEEFIKTQNLSGRIQMKERKKLALNEYTEDLNEIKNQSKQYKVRYLYQEQNTDIYKPNIHNQQSVNKEQSNISKTTSEENNDTLIKVSNKKISQELNDQISDKNQTEDKLKLAKKIIYELPFAGNPICSDFKTDTGLPMNISDNVFNSDYYNKEYYTNSVSKRKLSPTDYKNVGRQLRQFTKMN